MFLEICGNNVLKKRMRIRYVRVLCDIDDLESNEFVKIVNLITLLLMDLDEKCSYKIDWRR